MNHAVVAQQAADCTPADCAQSSNGSVHQSRAGELAQRIENIDLDPIKVKLMDSREGESWSRSYVDAVEVQYRQFLLLSTKYPRHSIVPTKAIDKFWHYHILDTRKYAADCEEAFGYFLHHFPYFGMRGEEDAKNLIDAFAATQGLVALEFGENTWVSNDGGDICSTQCESGNCAPVQSCESSVIRADLEVRPTLG